MENKNSGAIRLARNTYTRTELNLSFFVTQSTGARGWFQTDLILLVKKENQKMENKEAVSVVVTEGTRRVKHQ